MLVSAFRKTKEKQHNDPCGVVVVVRVCVRVCVCVCAEHVRSTRKPLRSDLSRVVAFCKPVQWETAFCLFVFSRQTQEMISFRSPLQDVYIHVSWLWPEDIKQTWS